MSVTGVRVVEYGTNCYNFNYNFSVDNVYSICTLIFCRNIAGSQYSIVGLATTVLYA